MKAHIKQLYRYKLKVKYPHPIDLDHWVENEIVLCGTSSEQVTDLFLRRVKSMGLDHTKFEITGLEYIGKVETNEEG